MRDIDSIQLFSGSNEEQLPGYSPDFPCITTRAHLYRYAHPQVPWHWHSTVEVFYLEQGALEYSTPNGTWVFPAGSGGFVNANVLHTSRVIPSADATIQLLHLFDPAFLSGGAMNRLYTKYILPLVSSGAELIPLMPEDAAQASVLEVLKQSFSLEEDQFGYEFSLRQTLTEVWLGLLQIPAPKATTVPGDNAIKAMMLFVHHHFSEDITVDQIAQAGLVSRRGCFRLFREQLHTTPLGYLREYRLQRSCDLLRQGQLSMTQIANQCGLGSSSYFGQQFRESFGLTPSHYRNRWHDPENFKRK